MLHYIMLLTYRKLNPMYEGYLQHDAQEVLQCILGHIQETCQILKEELKQRILEEPTVELEKSSGKSIDTTVDTGEDVSVLDGQAIENAEDKTKGNGKRKSDMEGGNEKKKSKVTKEKNAAEENQRRTRSKRKAMEEKLENHTEAIVRHPIENESTKPSQKKSRLKLNWLKSSSKQPSILSKFCSLGKLTTGFKDQIKEIENCELTEASCKSENGNQAGKEYSEPSSAMENTGEKGTGKHKRG